MDSNWLFPSAEDFIGEWNIKIHVYLVRFSLKNRNYHVSVALTKHLSTDNKSNGQWRNQFKSSIAKID
jgi:hypothetical protein